MKAKIYIASVNPFKSGVGQGNRPWTLYHVIDQKGLRYSTFEGKYIGMVGQEVEVEVEEKPSEKVNPKTGQPYINRNIIEPKTGATGANANLILIELKSIRKYVEEIHSMLLEPAEQDGGPEVGDLGKGDEINTNLQLPF